jgi:hypothetical protein
MIKKEIEMDIKDLKVMAYDTAIAIEKLQRKLAQLSQQIANAENLNMAGKVPDKPKLKQEK